MRLAPDLEREKLRLQKRELELKVRQHELEASRHQLDKQKRSVIIEMAKQPIFLAFVGAAISLMLASYQSYKQLEAEVYRMEGALISQAMQQPTREEAAERLRFLLELGLLNQVNRQNLINRIDSLNVPFSGQSSEIKVSSRSIDSLLSIIIPSNAFKNDLLIPRLDQDRSQIVIGVNYNIEDKNEVDIRRDWYMLDEGSIDLLVNSTGSVAIDPLIALPQLLGVQVDYYNAKKVFIRTNLVAVANNMLLMYPGIDLMGPDVQGAVMSLVWSRGASLENTASRSEMVELVGLIREGDVYSMIDAFERMKARLDPVRDSRAIQLRNMEIWLLRRSVSNPAGTDIVVIG